MSPRRDSADPAPASFASSSEPRLDEPYCRRVARPGGTTLHLVGVVHDHPASVARVRRVVAATTPDVLALELPDGSLPLYRTFAGDRPDGTGDGDDRARGGEMSAAIAAAPDASVVAIDPLDARFVASLVRTLVRERHDVETAWAVAERTLGVARRIAAHRLAAAGVGDPTAVAEGETYGCADATLAEQVTHESEHVSRCRLFRGVTEQPAVVRIATDARERRMAARLADLDGAETVLAVVGWSHLAPLVQRLD